MNILKIIRFVAPVIMKKMITPKRISFLFLFGFLFYTFYTLIPRHVEDPFFKHLEEGTEGTLEILACPEFPVNGFFLSKNSLNNWNYTKEHQEYGCTGLVYVNNKPFNNQSGCRRQFKSGEVFLFPGIYCKHQSSAVDNDTCVRCPDIRKRPKINCKANCPLTHPKNPTTLHKQLVDLLGGKTSDFMGFALKFDKSKNNAKIKYTSYTCNPQWFGSGKIGQCGNVDWQSKLDHFLKEKLN